MPKFNILDDLLQETFARKQSLTETNQELTGRYLDAFQEKVAQARAKRRHQKLLIEQLAKIEEANRDIEKKNQNLDKDLVQE